MIVFDESNLGILSKLISGNNNFDKTFKDDFNNKRYQTQVHSVGYVYDKVVSLFPNEEKGNTQFVIDSYEPITKGSFWRGIDNLKRVFNKTSINTVGNSNTLLELDSIGFFSKAIDSLMDGSAYDPNSALYWKLNDENGMDLELVESSDIINFTDDYEHAWYKGRPGEYKTSESTRSLSSDDIINIRDSIHNRFKKELCFQS
jgi:hypothetical protein